MTVGPAARPRGRVALAISAGAHALLIGTFVASPMLWPVALPEPAHDAVRVRLSSPPPPPPPPLPLGSLRVERPSHRPAATPAPTAPPSLVIPADLSRTIVATPPPAEVVADAGSPTGSVFGVPEGMEGGVEGGVVGGVPGGVLGGVVGGLGTGPIPVGDYDQAPRVVRTVKPEYPHEAVVAHVEGTVLLEVIVDEDGRVSRARVLESIPALDAAALAAVRRWLFLPARRRGQAVPAVVHAPITFRIY